MIFIFTFTFQALTTFRSGIVGIERKLQEKVDSNASNISIAFQDMKNLIDMAKDMVHLANVMSSKIKVYTFSNEKLD